MSGCYCAAVRVLTLGLVAHEVVDLGGGTDISFGRWRDDAGQSSPVETGDSETLVVHVKDQVLALLEEKKVKTWR